MIAVDTSALISVLFRENDSFLFEKFLRTEECVISAATFVECNCVLMRYRNGLEKSPLELLVRQMTIEISPFDEIQAPIASQAYKQFGKGSGHPAQLNLGDTFSYALAKTRNIPLLFKGNDFIHTDIMSALPQAA